MDYTTRELLQNHRIIVARKTALLAKLKALWAQEKLDDKITEMTFSTRRMDGMPRVLRVGKRTEDIALNYRDLVAKEIADEMTGLSEELEDIRLFLDNYENALTSLTGKQKELVRLHYDECLPLKRIAEKAMPLNGMDIYSESTLKRMNREIIKKINLVLGYKEPIGKVISLQ